MRRRGETSWWTIAITFGFAIALTFISYSCSNDSCESRGGHTEIVYGGRGGWVCEGATR